MKRSNVQPPETAISSAATQRANAGGVPGFRFGYPAWLRRIVAPSLRNIWTFALALFVLGGCARTDGPSYITLTAEQYHEAFDAAVDAARRYELKATLRDRRAGVIETEPAYAASIFEPWNRATLTFDRALESTVSFQRRRARFEFLAVDLMTATADEADETDAPADDLTRFDGELELRVWIYVERSHEPGMRPSTWSRRLATQTRVIDPETRDRIPTIWTPVARDPLLERHLLAQIQDALHGQ